MSGTWVGNLPVGDDFVQENSEGPHIRLDSEAAKVDGLWSRPLDRELSTCRGRHGLLLRAQAGRPWGHSLL